jgi:hypothetical protein
MPRIMELNASKATVFVTPVKAVSYVPISTRSGDVNTGHSRKLVRYRLAMGLIGEGLHRRLQLRVVG